MPPRKGGIRKRIKNLGRNAVKGSKSTSRPKEVPPEPVVSYLPDSPCSDNSNLHFYTSSHAGDSRSSFSESIESLPDEIEIQNEAQLLTFTEILQRNMQGFFEAAKRRIRPSRYNKVNPAPQTKRYRTKKIQDQTAALHKSGYSSIQSFFKRQRVSTNSEFPSYGTATTECAFGEGDSSAAQEGTGDREQEEQEEEEGQAPQEEEEEEQEQEQEREDDVEAMGNRGPMNEILRPGKVTQCASANQKSLADNPAAAHTKNRVVIEEISDGDDGDEGQEIPPINSNRQAHARPPSSDSPVLKAAIKDLSKRSKAKTLDIVFRGRLVAMLAFLRFYTSGKGTSWREASLLAATAAGKGKGLARSLREWVWEYLEDNTQLPVSLYGKHNKSRLQDEDLAAEIHLHLQSLNKKYLQAMDIVRYFEDPEVKSRLKVKKTPSERTARRWMHVMKYRYGKDPHGMYVDGHEREDVVEYRTDVFLPFWASIEDQMMTWTNDNDPIYSCAMPTFPQQKRIVLVTHDESTFYANDRRKTRWVHASETAEPVKKGEGASIMVSDFCSPDIGWLKSKNGSREARILFKAGKNRDGYFDCDDLCSQTELAIEIFEENFPGTAVAAFGFDNAPGHQKRADDALSARYMPKFPKVWLGKNGKCKMRPGRLPNGEPQEFYYPDDHPTMPGWFKGMKTIIEERGFAEEGNLPAECKKFKCTDPASSCCCRRLLFNQEDFKTQKPAIIELVESHGHIAFFYPKFHCELNFIEQCWGAAKYRYRMLPPTENEAEMEKNVRMCLESVDLIKMRRFSNRSARFMHAYRKGLNGSQASWANRKYHGHRILPDTILKELDKIVKRE